MGTFQIVNKRLATISFRNLGPKPTGCAGVSNSDAMYLAIIQMKPASNANNKDCVKISVALAKANTLMSGQ